VFARSVSIRSICCCIAINRFSKDDFDCDDSPLGRIVRALLVGEVVGTTVGTSGIESMIDLREPKLMSHDSDGVPVGAAVGIGEGTVGMSVGPLGAWDGTSVG
jgi:hypothetical protein